MGRFACVASSKVNKIFILLTKIIPPKSRDSPLSKENSQPELPLVGCLIMCVQEMLWIPMLN